MSPANPLLPDDAAVQAARRHLEAQGMGPALVGRTVSVQHVGMQTVVRFSPPAGTLGGDFKLTLDAANTVVAQELRH